MRVLASFATTLSAALVFAACSGKFESAAANAGSTQDGGPTGGARASSGGSKSGTGGSRATGGRVGTGGAGNTAGNGTGGGVSGGGTGGGVIGGGTDGAVIGNGGAVSADASVVDGGTPVSCNSPADCPAPVTVCQTAACVGHQCGFVGVPSAVPTTNKLGDCQKLICNQNGAEVAIADSADSDDGNPCTADSCQGTLAVHAVRNGATCAGGICDPSGACVAGCTQDADCPQGATECTKQKCVQGTCQRVPPGTLCNGLIDQCDDTGTCVDCWNSGGCDECCVCSNKVCIPA
jgi:hypothetical protein